MLKLREALFPKQCLLKAMRRRLKELPEELPSRWK
jgi:hypothetical protein